MGGDRLRIQQVASIWLRAFLSFRIWTHLGWRDIRTRYALTRLGPWWSTLSYAMFSLILGVVYATVFQVDVAEYLPFIASGLVSWYAISAIVSESVGLPTYYKTLLLNLHMPIPTLALAVVWRNLAVFLQSAPVALAISVIGLRTFNLNILWLVPGLLLFFLGMTPISYLLALSGSRTPALAVVMPSLLLLAFLTTPILWDPAVLGERTWVYRFNPLYWFISLIRQPLQFEAPPPMAWVVVTLCLAIFYLLAFSIASTNERRVALRL